MIVYRIISEEEYKTYQRGNVYVSPRRWDDANKIYDKTSIDINYLYFFPYYEACLEWPGKYVIKANIPDELVETGIGAYSSPVRGSVKYVLLDECRIDAKAFDPKTQILEVVDAEDLRFGNAGQNWENSEEYKKAGKERKAHQSIQCLSMSTQ